MLPLYSFVSLTSFTFQPVFLHKMLYTTPGLKYTELHPHILLNNAAVHCSPGSMDLELSYSFFMLAPSMLCSST